MLLPIVWNSDVFRGLLPLNKTPRFLQHEVEGENVQRLKRSHARRQPRQFHRGQCDQVTGIPTVVRTREGNHGGPTAQPLRSQNLLSSVGLFHDLHSHIFNSYASIRLYFAQSDSPLHNLLFHTVGDAENFTLVVFEFQLLDHPVESDIVLYDFTYSEFEIRLYVWGIDSVEPCGTESNVDFVHFVWDNSADFPS